MEIDWSSFLSDHADWEGGDLGSAKLSHGSEDALHVGASLHLGSGGGIDVGVLSSSSVLVVGKNESKKAKVTIGDLIAGTVSTSIGEALFQLADKFVKGVNAGLTSSLIGIVLHQSVALGLLQAIHYDTIHPLGFIESLRCGRSVAVVHS